MLKAVILACVLVKSGASQYNANKIAPIVIKYSKKRQLDPILIASLIYRESRYRQRATSKTNDYGLMQVHCPYSKYAWWCKSVKRLYGIDFNIAVGTLICTYKRKRMKKQDKTWLKYYNPGSKTYTSKVLKTYKFLKKLEGQCKKQIAF